MKDLLQRGCAGGGALALLSGEAGVGKTRLIKEAEALARQAGMLTLWGRCVLAEGAPPYQPLLEQIEQAARIVPAQALRAALGENAPEVAKLMPELRQRFSDIPQPVALPPDQERRYLLHGCGEFIDRAGRLQPILLVFEDLHWAGESTCRLLHHLAGRLRDSPVLMIGAYRETDLDPSHPFAETMRELLRERLAEDIPLKPLAVQDVSALLEGFAGHAPPPALVSLVFAETEGNPFFVEELYRHLDESGKLFGSDGRLNADISIADAEVPPGVRLIVEHRLARISEDCRRLLASAAVAGRVVTFDLLASIGDLPEDALLDALEEAQGAALLDDVSSGREPRYQFVHELIRQTLLSGLSLPRRQRLHLRIADVLEAASPGAPEKNASDIAFHLYQAGAIAQGERTVRFLLAAARRAVDAVAFEDALKLLDMAAEVAPAEDRPSRARIQGLRGLSLRGAAQIDDALTALAEGLALGDDVDGFTELVHQRAALLVDLYRGEEALADIERLLNLAQAKDDTALELSAQRLLAEAHYRLSLDRPEHAELARKACDRTIELARAANDQRALVRGLILASNFVDYWEDYRPIALQNLNEAKAIAEVLHDESLMLDEASLRLRVAFSTLEELTEGAEAVLKRLEALRDPIRLKEHLFWMILPTRRAGHFERSVEIAERAIEMAARLGVPPVQYPTFKAWSLLALGRFGEAWASLDQEVTHGGYRFGAALQRFGQFIFRCQIGAVQVALAEAKPLISECRALRRAWMVEFLIEGLAIASALGGQLDEALGLLRSEAGERPLGDVGGGLAGGHIALAQGDVAGALETAQRLQESFAKAGMRQPEADAEELACLALIKLERWQEARDVAARQISFCEQSGYRRLHWRLLALRAEALTALGDTIGAQADFDAAARMLHELAQTLPTTEFRDAFLTQPVAVRVQEAAKV